LGVRVDRIIKGTLKGNLGIYSAKGPRDLAPQRLQQRIIEREDAALAALAAENSKPADEAPPAVPAVAKADDMRGVVFDAKAPYAEVRGESGCAFIQGKWYFSREREPVKQAPEHAWYFPPAAVKKDSRKEAEREIARLPGFSEVPRAPRVIIEAEKENAQAAAAEALAE